jgi:two-component system chemotaxis sensor kinase CheA
MRLEFDLQPGDDRLFTDESVEQIERIEEGLLKLERGDLDAPLLNEIFRAAHTLKGSAGTIGHTRLAGLTHAMEDVFGAMRSGRLVDARPLADLLLSTVDVLRALVDEVTAGEVLTDAAEGLTGELRAAHAAAEAASAGGTPAEAAGGAAAGPAAAGPASGSGFHADDPRVVRLLAEAPHGDGPATLAWCAVDPASQWGSVRLMQLEIEAQASGALLASVPSREEIESGLESPGLALLLRGRPEDLEALKATLRSVDEVTAVDLWLSEAAKDEPSGAARRQIDLGPEARGMSATEQRAVAGERLKTAQQTIRIDVTRLDELMNLVGELIVQKTRIQQHARDVATVSSDDTLAREAEAISQQFSRIAGQLQDQVTGLRMLPIDSVFSRFPRVVRDIASRLGKSVRLEIEGKETELDRSVLEEVGDPLGHLVRNALDHGLETAEERQAAGKNPEGLVRLTARHADGQILITVEDDGKGMDPARLRAAAVSKGILTQEAAAAMGDDEALRLIFAPGFSTAAKITDVSGRGVGMDVVRTNIERLGGRVEIHSTMGRGTQVELSLPLTLAIIGALMVRSGDRVCALPLTGVVETLRLDASALSTVGGRHVITLRGRVVPVEVLDNALGDPRRALEPGPRGLINLVVVRSRSSELALAVDDFVGQQEIVLKSMGTFAGRLNGVAGATIMADGRVALVADIGALLEHRVVAPGRGQSPLAA